MKRFWFVISLGAVGILIGCATMILVGGLYTGAKFPIIATSNSSASSKTGEAQCISILALVAVGDCIIEMLIGMS
ncbi:MAG: TRL domain-containing protein [Smithella sp.]